MNTECRDSKGRVTKPLGASCHHAPMARRTTLQQGDGPEGTFRVLKWLGHSAGDGMPCFEEKACRR